MPPRHGELDGTVSFMSRLRKRIKNTSTLAFQKSFPRGLILDKKEVGMKFEKSIIISS
jgi:hypothetical protein